MQLITPNKRLDIVLLYGPTWDQPAQLSKHHLVRYWSKTRRVLYVESPFNPVSFITRKDETKRLAYRYRHGPILVSENLWVHTFFYPLPYRGSRMFFGARWVNTVNQYFILPRLIRVLRILHFNNPVLFVGGAHAQPIIQHIPHRLLTYHCSDDYTLVPSFPKSFHTIEADLIRRCDLVIATAEELRKAKLSFNRNTHTVTNGVEYDHFAKAQEHSTTPAPELSVLPKPVIGYIGSVFRWIDQHMVSAAAIKHPEWTFVFIGPVQTDVSILKKHPNIHLLGPRPYSNLPSYLKAFDVATIPFVINELTGKVSPIKFYEYLASGVPVVATYMPDIAQFSTIARIVNTTEQFISAVEHSLKGDSEDKKHQRMAAARSQSWPEKFRLIDSLIEKALASRA